MLFRSAQLARIAAIPATLIFPFFFGADAVPLIFAHLANWAARILALPAALTLRLLGASSWAGLGTSPPKIAFNSLCRTSILSLMSAALRSCVGVALIIVRAIWNKLAWWSSIGVLNRRSLHDLQAYSVYEVKTFMVPAQRSGFMWVNTSWSGN